METSVPKTKALVGPAVPSPASTLAPDALLETSAPISAPLAASIPQPQLRTSRIEKSAHVSMDTLMPNPRASIKPLPHDNNQFLCHQGLIHTSTALDMGNSSALSENHRRDTAAPGGINMKSKKVRKSCRIQNTSRQQVTFCKRRNVLFKNAQKLSDLCNAEVGAIVFSPSGRLSEFASSSMSHVIKRYQRYQPQILSNDLQGIERWKHQTIPLGARLKCLREFQRCAPEKDSSSLAINEIQNIETILERSLERIQKRKMEVLEMEMLTTMRKGEALCVQSNTLKEKLMQKVSKKKHESNSFEVQNFNKGQGGTKLRLWLDILQGTEGKESSCSSKE